MTTPSTRNSNNYPVAMLVAILTLSLAGCGREAPPEIQDFKPPVVRVIDDTPATQPAETTPVVAEAPKREEAPEEKPKPVKAAATEAAASEAPKEAPKKTPSVIGSWRLSKMVQGGHSVDLPPGMDMTLTFNEDGTLSMSQSFQGQSHDMSGTYTLADNQITITMMGQAKTGNYTLSGDTELTMDMDGGQVTFTRS